MRRFATFTAALTAMSVLAVPASAAPAPTSDALTGASTTYAATIGAATSGYTGAGVGVALIDTGVSPMPGLADGIAAQVDVSGIGRNTDGHGHGTFLAGLIVGEDGPTGTRLGVAPDAHVVSVKVADAHGRTSLDRILAGLAAIKAAPAELNLRVIVIAIGGPQDGVADPLEEALEQMWADGYVVVVASGNTAGQLTEPGTSPYLLTVGAIDDRNTADAGDDDVAAWSGSGLGRDDAPKPDVLAPGKSVVSVRVPGSTADIENPDSRIGGQWFRGSGTSQAAAVVAGAAAVLLEARPDLGPDDVKGRLADGARPISGSHAGVVDIAGALGSTAVANTHLQPLTPTGTTPPEGEWQGKSWTGKSWTGKSWTGKSWTGDIWIGKSWTGKSWTGKSWTGKSWTGKSWTGKSWTGGYWVGKSWTEFDWNGSQWIGKSWTDTEWAGKSWTTDGWVGKSWTGHAWVDAEWTGRSWTSRSWH